MTPQEQTMLSGLIDRVNGTRLPEKDQDAENLIQQRLASNPDALYILSQTVLVQKYALDQAQAQIEQLRRQQTQQLQQPEHKASFLGGLFGHRDEPQQTAPAPPPPRQYAPSAAPGNYPPQPAAYQPVGYAPQGAPAAGGGGSSFLRSAATTAAGVAAGALAFQGVESLLHGFGHQAGFGGGGFLGGAGMAGMGGPVDETVVNNYYGTPNPGDASQNFDNAGYDPGSAGLGSGQDRLDEAQDLSQQGSQDLQPQLDQASDVNVTGDNGGVDDSQDAGFQDVSDGGGGFDDNSGGFGDDSGGFSDDSGMV
jgi:hypothetical protein